MTKLNKHKTREERKANFDLWRSRCESYHDLSGLSRPCAAALLQDLWKAIKLYLWYWVFRSKVDIVHQRLEDLNGWYFNQQHGLKDSR